MRILLVGDFGGARPSARPQKFLRVDPDAPGLERLGARAEATILGHRAAWPLRSAEDFAPDALVELWDDARRVLDARTKLADGGADAAADLERMLERDSGPASSGPAPAAPASPATGDRAPTPLPPDLFASVLAETPSAPSEDTQIEGLIRSATEASLRRLRDTTGPERRKRLLAAADEHLASVVRVVLAAPRVRALEGAWRGLDLVSRALVSVEAATLHVADLSRDELDADVGVAGPLEGELFRHLVDHAGEKGRADLVVLAFPFDALPRDIATLLRLARLADAGGFSILADAAPGLAAGRAQGAASELWRAFRRVPEARRVGLVHPQVLLRGPYGREHRRTERFEFEEFPGRIDPEKLLWGPGACAVAAILATSFESEDGAFACVSEPELTGLPSVTTTDEDGETVLVPCASRRLGAREVQAVNAGGILPLVASGDSSAVRLVQLTSCADPPAPLAAPSRS
jgi:predicted component of type VI protein secretion system